MQKTRSTLLHFFSEPLVDILLPHIINAERTPLHGVEKQTLVLGELNTQLRSDHIVLAHEGNNLSIPWKVLFPIILDSFLRILNIIIGKEWIKEEVDESAPPTS